MTVTRDTKGPRDPEEEVPLLPVEEWRERILSSVEVLAPVTVALPDAWRCVLAEDIRSPRDLPSFASSAMDGFAVRSGDIGSATEERPAALDITGEVRMGRSSDLHVSSGQAVIVPTGGVVPDGADAVVPVELCAIDGGRVLVYRALPFGKHVRPAGEDVGVGDVLAASQRRLFAPDMGALAAAGVASVPVHPRARVAILSTGDEIVAVSERLSGAQIHDSNAHTLAATVREAGAVPVMAGIVRDEPEALVEALDRVAGDADVIVCSGGVSAGERDPVKRAFVDGGDVAFANVAMQPGRPQAFGTWKGKPFFGLPGNPISVFVSFETFVRPALMKMMGRTDVRPIVVAVLDGELDAPRTRTRFARVRLRRDDDGYVATPEGGHQSNLLVTFARADGLVEVPAGTKIGPGDPCRVTLIRDP